MLHGGRMRVYYSTDLVGVEIGGAVKNVMAIAAGISDGMGSASMRAPRSSRAGLAEIARLGAALGGAAGNLHGSRRRGRSHPHGDRRPLAQPPRRPGARAAAARSKESSPASATWPKACAPRRRSRARRRERGVDMPVTEAVNAVLDGQLTPAVAVERLLARESKMER